MNILSQLIAAYLFENATTPYSQSDYAGGRYLLAPYGVTPIMEPSGKNAIQLAGNDGNLAVGQCLVRNADSTLDLKHSANTVAIRFRMDSLPIAGSGAYVLLTETPVNANLYNMAKYWVKLVWGGGDSVTALITLNGVPPPLTSVVTMNAHLLTPIKVGEWHTLFFGWDDDTRRYFVKLDTDDPLEVGLIYPTLGVTSREFVVGGNRKYGTPTVQDQCLNGALGALYMWKRLLSRQEMDEIAGGLDYPFQVQDPDANCDAVPCCQDPEPSYSASNPTPSGFTNKNPGIPEPPIDVCSPVPVVTIDPPSGTVINVPSYVVLFLYASRPNANIYYTTDGEDPTVYSNLYTGPFIVDDPATVVKAIAVITGCPPGPVAVATFTYDPTFVWSFSMMCDTPDFVGRWGQFGPAYGGDYHWRLMMHWDRNVTIKRIEIYQTTDTGYWDTGQAWSTDEYINPAEGPPNFHVFPLEIWSGCDQYTIPPACGVQQNHAYLSTYGAVVAGDYIWDLYGQPNYALYGFFKINIYLDDGTRYSQIVKTDCIPPPPPPCVNPDPITVTAQCGSLLIKWVQTAGLAYRLERKGDAGNDPGCGATTDWVVLQQGNIAYNCDGATAECYTDTDVKPGCTYCYRLAVIIPPCANYTYSPTVCGSPLCKAAATLTVSWLNNDICSGQVKICYSSTCVDGSVTITDDHGSPPQTVPGNSSGCILVAWPGGLTGIVCWSLLAPNATCGDVIITGQCVERTPPACTACDGISTTGKDIYGITGYTAWGSDSNCNLDEIKIGPSVIPWNGQFQRVPGAACLWTTNGGGFLLGLLLRPPADGSGWIIISGDLHYDCVATLQWILNIWSGNATIWRGVKQCGLDPSGTYTKLVSCMANAPATVTVA